jgi:hypothetical protein
MSQTMGDNTKVLPNEDKLAEVEQILQQFERLVIVQTPILCVRNGHWSSAKWGDNDHH